MLFGSLDFVFLLLPVTLFGWYFLNKKKMYKLASVFLTGASLWFYGYANPWYLILVILSVLANFLFSYLFEKKEINRKLILILGLILNIGLLGYYKYANFFVDNLNSIFNTSIVITNIVLPLGISFFTLTQIAFLVDRYRGDFNHPDIIDYSAFVLYFPKLISGPIVFYKEFAPEFKNRENFSFDREEFLFGLIRFILGLSKKILIADVFSYYTTYAMSYIYSLDTLSAWACALFYSIQLYFDFSGYSDMAIGISSMFGIKLSENFNSPYKARSVKDFWKRWHISLTKFLTRYLYIPLGGNRKGTVRMVLNTIIVFFISGLWHGASWTFVLWGVLHAVAILISGFIHKKKKEGVISHVFTMIFVVFGWAVFNCNTWDNLVVMINKLLTPSYNGFIKDFSTALASAPETYALMNVLEVKAPQLIMPLYGILTVILLIVAFALMCGKNTFELINDYKENGITTGKVILLGFLFMWCVISFSFVSTFLYFTF